MRTEQLVRTTATVVRIVELEPGNVYKRLHEAPYSDNVEIKMGVVQSVLNNGEKTAITALEFNADYNGVKPQIKVFSDKTDLQLFDATPDEVQSYFDDLRERASADVTDANEKLQRARNAQAAVREATTAALSAPKTQTGFTELPGELTE